MDFTQSPVSDQHFIWVAEYNDQTFLTEFDYTTKQENSFTEIDKDRLIRFGLGGYGMHLYHEVLGGVFKIAGKMIEIIYRVGNKDYFLTGQPMVKYQDIISYKNAESIINTRTGQTSDGVITQYNFGYKQSLVIDDITFHFKPLCKIPYGGRVLLNIWLASDTSMNGKIIIRKNGGEVFKIDAPLENGLGGSVDWVVSN